MGTPFDAWLAALQAAGKGPLTLFASRGRLYAETLELGGDYTGATLRGEVRLTPDATGAALAEFTVGSPVVSGGTTLFDIALSEADTGALPADSDGSGVVELAYDLLLTPLDETEALAVGGKFVVLGRITA